MRDAAAACRAARARAGGDAEGPLRGARRPRPPRAGAHAGAFRYVDKGNLATIGRARAVADLKGVHLSGLLAWLTWLLVHLFYLVGFQNRVLVFIRWAFSFVTRGRGARLITYPVPAEPRAAPAGRPATPLSASPPGPRAGAAPGRRAP